MVDALHLVFSNIPRIRRLADPVPMARDLLNPKSIGFDWVLVCVGDGLTGVSTSYT